LTQLACGYARRILQFIFKLPKLSPTIHKYDNVFIQTSVELSRGPQDLVLSEKY
jgi:hypothetical protein